MLKEERSFTLIELLLVIGIVAALSTAAIVVLNAPELLKRSRDAARETDLVNLNKAIALLFLEQSSAAAGNAGTIYLSLPDPAASPTSDCSGLGLQAPSGWTYECKSPNSYKKADGTGWLPVDFGSFSSGPLFSALPADPVNDASQNLFYAYVPSAACPGGGYALAANLEAQRSKAVEVGDGGNDFTRFELGKEVSCWGRAQGLIGYWKLDEILGGNITLDASGYGNHGNAVNGPLMVAGKVGNALDFDASLQQEVSMSGVLPVSTNATLMGWFLWKGIGEQDRAWFRDSGLVEIWTLMYQKVTSRVGWTVAQIMYDPGWGLGQYLNLWHHFAVTKAGNTMRYYIDGRIPPAEGGEDFSSTGVTPSVAPWHIMRNVRVNKYDSGTVDEIRIYNRALTSQEIADYYNATR